MSTIFRDFLHFIYPISLIRYMGLVTTISRFSLWVYGDRYDAYVKEMCQNFECNEFDDSVAADLTHMKISSVDIDRFPIRPEPSDCRTHLLSFFSL